MIDDELFCIIQRQGEREFDCGTYMPLYYTIDVPSKKMAGEERSKKNRRSYNIRTMHILFNPPVLGMKFSFSPLLCCRHCCLSSQNFKIMIVKLFKGILQNQR